MKAPWLISEWVVECYRKLWYSIITFQLILFTSLQFNYTQQMSPQAHISQWNVLTVQILVVLIGWNRGELHSWADTTPTKNLPSLTTGLWRGDGELIFVLLSIVDNYDTLTRSWRGSVCTVETICGQNEASVGSYVDTLTISWLTHNLLTHSIFTLISFHDSPLGTVIKGCVICEAKRRTCTFRAFHNLKPSQSSPSSHWFTLKPVSHSHI